MGATLPAYCLLREHPEVLAVIVDLRIRHVERSVLVGLDGKEILRIPQMRFQIRRKLIQVYENARKRTPVDRQDGVVRIHDVELDGSVVHVHNHLYGVSNVVQPFLKGRRVGGGVGKVIRDGVGILDPILFALAHHGVGILVEAQERSDLLHALLNAPPDLNLALRLKIGGKQDVDVGLSPGEQEPLPQAVQRDASRSGVTRVDILIPLGVVELFHARRDDPISRHRLAVVDGRLVYGQAVGGFGRDILKHVLRKASPHSL